MQIEYTYDSVGNRLTKNNNGTLANYTYDANAGFYYLRARYMDPDTGRFFTMDSFEGNAFEPVSLHKYLYANANPVSFIDPSGNMALLSLIAESGINLWTRTLPIRNAITTYWKANETVQRIKLGMNVAAVTIGFMMPLWSRNSVSYKIRIPSTWDLDIEIRYGRIGKSKEFEPEQLRLSFVQNDLLQWNYHNSVRLDIPLRGGSLQLTGQLPPIEIYKRDIGLGFSVSSAIVLETTFVFFLYSMNYDSEAYFNCFQKMINNVDKVTTLTKVLGIKLLGNKACEMFKKRNESYDYFGGFDNFCRLINKS